MVFRDHHLSNRIGFVYQHMSGRDAAEDLIHRLLKIREHLGKNPDNFLVTIALTVRMPGNGIMRIKRLFTQAPLSGHFRRSILGRPVTVSEFCRKIIPKKGLSLTRLQVPGWITVLHAGLVQKIKISCGIISRKPGKQSRNTKKERLIEKRLIRL